MSRPATARQQWLNLRQTLFSTPTPLHPRANSSLCANLRVANKNALRATRPFHTTPPKKARPAPSTRLRMRASQPSTLSPLSRRPNTVGDMFDRDGLLRHPLLAATDLEQMLQDFEALAAWQYDTARKDGLLPSQISFKTYKEVCVKLINTSSQSVPSAQAIRGISIDVDSVCRVGYVMSHFEPLLREWVLSAGTAAGARMPVCIAAARILQRVSFAPHMKLAQAVEKLAGEEYPPALVLHAKLLGQRGKLEEAIWLLETKVLPFISPRSLGASPFQDLTLSGGMELPHKVYALLQAAYDAKYNSLESRQKADDAIRIAALEYQDANSLMEYASIMMDENNLDKYEECMSMAATAGIPKACLYLANFYYLTFHGKYATRGERKTGSLASTSPPKPTTTPTNSLIHSPTKMFGPVVTWIASFFGQSLSRKEYHGLAADWYYLAYWHGEPRAAFMLGLIWREDGYDRDGRIILEQAQMENDADFSGKVEALKRNWFNKDYEPRLPKRMLDVR